MWSALSGFRFYCWFLDTILHLGYFKLVGVQFSLNSKESFGFSEKQLSMFLAYVFKISVFYSRNLQYSICKYLKNFLQRLKLLSWSTLSDSFVVYIYFTFRFSEFFYLNIRWNFRRRTYNNISKYLINWSFWHYICLKYDTQRKSSCFCYLIYRSREKAVFYCECIFWFIFSLVYGREKLNWFCGQPASCLTQAHS